MTYRFIEADMEEQGKIGEHDIVTIVSVYGEKKTVEKLLTKMLAYVKGRKGREVDGRA